MQTGLRLILIAVLLTLGAVANAQDDNWDFTIKPYLMATSIEGNVGMSRIAGAPIDLFSKSATGRSMSTTTMEKLQIRGFSPTTRPPMGHCYVC